MSNMLALNCLILGEDINIEDIFIIEIVDTVTIDKLKCAISAERGLMPNNIQEASKLHIYKASFLIDDNLKENVRIFGQDVIGVQAPLSPMAKLSKLFLNLPGKYLHVIVQVPPEIARQSLTSEPLLRLWCYVLDDDPKKTFSVEIAPTVSVSALKGMIKEIQRPRFDAIQINTLELYSVSIPSTESGQLGSLDKKTLPSELLATRILSEVFSDSLAPDHIHIIVDSPNDDPRAAKRRRINPSSNWKRYRKKLEEYRVKYWGTPLEPNLTVLPDNLQLEPRPESSDDILPGEPFTDCLDLNRIFIRAEYVRKYDEVEKAHKHNPYSVVILTGQPGIGKTYWICYAVRRRLGQRKPVFVYQENKFIFYSSTGVEIVDSPRDVECEDYTWCFVDSGQARDPFPTTASMPQEVFPIYVSPPSEHRWAHLEQIRPMVEVFLMDPWTWAEIEKAASLEKYQNLTRDEISERFKNAGPTARICLSYKQDQLAKWYEVREINVKTTWIDKLVRDLTGSTNSIPIGAISYGICVVRCAEVKGKYRVEPMSQAVVGLLLTRLKNETLRNREKLLQCFSKIHQAAGMVGWLFEFQYHEQFTTKIELEAHPMYRHRKINGEPKMNSPWYSPFGYKPEHYSGSPCKISISPKKRVKYENTNTKINIEPDVYYTPVFHNQEIIDSLIVHSGRLYLFQFITSADSEHKLNNRTKILSRFNGLPSREHQYVVFVVPKSQENLVCPYLEGEFLGDNAPYVAQVDLHKLIDSADEV